MSSWRQPLELVQRVPALVTIAAGALIALGSFLGWTAIDPDRAMSYDGGSPKLLGIIGIDAILFGVFVILQGLAQREGEKRATRQKESLAASRGSQAALSKGSLEYGPSDKELKLLDASRLILLAMVVLFCMFMFMVMADTWRGRFRSLTG